MQGKIKSNVTTARAKLKRYSSIRKAKIVKSFFKTGPGQYGEGDVFLGVTVPNIRTVAQEYRNLPISETLKLLCSVVHEERLLALLILIAHYQNGSDAIRKKIFNIYINHVRYINNWDLVDLSAPHIVGDFLIGRSKQPLYALARSKSLWKKRIAIVATFAFIRTHRFDDTLRIARLLLDDTHDLIHKAVGWMLREVGKHNQRVLECFLSKYIHTIPRTTLRYAIERFSPAKRRIYLRK